MEVQRVVTDLLAGSARLGGDHGRGDEEAAPVVLFVVNRRDRKSVV